MSITKAQYRAQKKYDAANTRQYRLKLTLNHDEDIINWLNRQDSKQGAIKKLIRQQIDKEASGK